MKTDIENNQGKVIIRYAHRKVTKFDVGQQVLVRDYRVPSGLKWCFVIVEIVLSLVTNLVCTTSGYKWKRRVIR